MKEFLACFLFCCRGETEKEKPVQHIQELEIIEKIENSSDKIKNCGSFEEPDKEKLPEGDITEIRDNAHLRVRNIKRPSIILSMDGSEHKVVLYDGNVKRKKKKSKHKRKKKNQKK